MATASDSLQQGQVPIQCQLCDTDPNIQFKCLDCSLLMCTKCKEKIHTKIKTEKPHRVLGIGEVGSSEDLQVELNVIQEYQINVDFVGSPTTSLDDCLWIGSGIVKTGFLLFGSHKPLQKVKLTGSRVKVISGFNIMVFGMAVTPSNDLLVCTGGPRLKQIDNGTDKVKDSPFSVEPFGRATAVHVTRDNRVIVGANKSVVIVMDRYGCHKTVIDKDKDNKKLFSYPWSITTTMNGNMFVVDSKPRDPAGKVIVLSGSRDVITVYTGHPNVNTKCRLFKPLHVITTPADNIIVTDLDTHTLHILNNMGQVMAYYDTRYIGIYHPYSLAITATVTTVGISTTLYIGCTTPEGSTENGKLYKVNLSGC